jgi:DUF1680 family protein
MKAAKRSASDNSSPKDSTRRGITKAAFSPYAKLRSVDLSSVTWTEGFWAERFAVCRTEMVPNMWRLLADPRISHAYANFLIAAGRKKGKHRGPPFFDGDLYKWLEASASVYAATKARDTDMHLDEVISVIGEAQEDDGYIHTPATISRINGDGSALRFEDPINFEMYNFGHLMTAACSHFKATGKTNLLQIARRTADYLCSAFEKPDADLAKHAICPSHYMGAVELYRATGQRRYLELAKNLIAMRDLVQGGSDQNQDRVPFREQKTAMGHAVRANYLYAGVADICAETGDGSLIRSLEAIWENMAYRKVYITGATGALYDGASPDGSSHHDQIGLVHQAYGRDYQLPNVTAYNESCATIGNVLWSWRMLALTAQARYADMIELALYNGVLSTISLDGKSFFYVNTLRKEKDLPFELRWSRTREPYISCFCCPPNTVRTIAQAASYAYCLSEQGLWVNLFGASLLKTRLLNGIPLTLRQETDYPWDGEIKISLELETDAEFAVMVRIPEWADGAYIMVNGVDAAEAVPGTYAEIKRCWHSGDIVELSLPMEARLIEAHPLVEETRSQVAVKRGPLVYCLESSDLPEGAKVSEIMIPRNIELREKAAFPLAGTTVTALEGIAILRREGDWTGLLYRPIAEREDEDIDVRLIPYFGWGNRGDGQMTVWMPAG